MSEDSFRDFYYQVRPIRLREPLASMLGAFRGSENILEFTFIDAVRAAGHACPTVSGAYLSCQAALDALYGEEVPSRGETGITIYGSADKGALGVMAQVFTLITGAAPESGFKGLGGRFSRKDLLNYEEAEPGREEPCFRFERLDSGAAVMVRFYPWLIPFSEESSARLAVLMGPVVAGEAPEEDRNEFQDLWQEKIRGMLIDRNQIDTWIKVEAAS